MSSEEEKKKPDNMTLKDFEAYKHTNDLLKPPKTVDNLRNVLKKIFPEEACEEIEVADNHQRRAFVYKNMTAENLFVFFATLFFMLIMFVFVIKFGTNNNIADDYVGLTFGSLISGLSYWLKLRQKTGDKQIAKEDEERAVSFGYEVIQKNLEVERFEHERMLQSSKLDFFAREIVNLIATIPIDRIPAIELAMQALVYSEGGILVKEIREVKDVIVNYHAELVTMQEKGIFKEGISTLNGKVAKYKKIVIVKANTIGIITEINDYCREILPVYNTSIGQHWTHVWHNRPAQQLQAMMKMIEEANKGFKKTLEANFYVTFDQRVIPKVKFIVQPDLDKYDNQIGIICFFELIDENGENINSFQDSLKYRKQKKIEKKGEEEASEQKSEETP